MAGVGFTTARGRGGQDDLATRGRTNSRMPCLVIVPWGDCWGLEGSFTF